MLQKRVLGLIYFVDRKEHAIPLFVNAKILPISFVYNEAVCKLMLDVHNNSAPSNITRTSNIHTYNPRLSTSQIFSVKYSRLKIQKKKAFSRVGVKVWNEMPNEYKNLAKKSFKKETKRALLNILETKDPYMEPDEIMLKVKHSKIESNYAIMGILCMPIWLPRSLELLQFSIFLPS